MGVAAAASLRDVMSVPPCRHAAREASENSRLCGAGREFEAALVLARPHTLVVSGGDGAEGLVLLIGRAASVRGLIRLLSQAGYW